MQGSNEDADRERLSDKGQWEEGEGEINGEGSMEAYTPPYIKQIVNGNFLYDSGNPNWGSVTT